LWPIASSEGRLPRWERIRYESFDEEGKRINRSFDGFHAQVVQYECDHLDGVLYPDRIEDRTAFGFTVELVAAGVLPAGRGDSG
jgi:peptide deformylase